MTISPNHSRHAKLALRLRRMHFAELTHLLARSPRRRAGSVRFFRWATTRAPLHTLLLAAWVVALATSCSVGRQPIVDVTVRNNTTNKLGWAELNWGEGSLGIGSFHPGKGITFGDAGLPKSVRSNMATIEFVNEDDPRVHLGSDDERVAMRRQLIQKVPVDITPLLQLASGHYQATFSLLSLTNAELSVRPKEKIP